MRKHLQVRVSHQVFQSVSWVIFNITPINLIWPSSSENWGYGGCKRTHNHEKRSSWKERKSGLCAPITEDAVVVYLHHVFRPVFRSIEPLLQSWRDVRIGCDSPHLPAQAVQDFLVGPHDLFVLFFLHGSSPFWFFLPLWRRWAEVGSRCQAKATICLPSSRKKTKKGRNERAENTDTTRKSRQPLDMMLVQCKGVCIVSIFDF